MHTKKERDKLIKQFNASDVKYYPFWDKSEKTFAYVIKGLDNDPTLDEIKADLQAKNLKITNIYQMKTGQTRRYVFMIITLDHHKIADLNNKQIFNVYKGDLGETFQ